MFRLLVQPRTGVARSCEQTTQMKMLALGTGKTLDVFGHVAALYLSNRMAAHFKPALAWPTFSFVNQRLTYSVNRIPMITYFSEKHRLHAPECEFFRGRFSDPFERPERAEIIAARIGEVAPGTIRTPREFGIAPVAAVHGADYLDFLKTCWGDWRASGRDGNAIAVAWPTRRLNSPRIPEDIGGRVGYYGMATDTTICQGTWEAALSSKDVALSALEDVLGGSRAAMGLCRPPGHHAATDQFAGYCFLNNAAIAAQYARESGERKVAVLDIDFHHANGTQSIFYDRQDVCVASIHGHPTYAFPYFLGYEDERGDGDGTGFNHNYPLGPGTAYREWKNCLADALGRIVDFGSELLIVSLGVDTFENDPISFFKLHVDDFTDIGMTLARAELPTAFLMEGGYAVQEIGINVANVLTGFESV